ncbi:MAG TPA: HEAT repeat domain-containing protein [Anaerolineales bacterium]|nr:HEAT repeat domain-containing protein [Anaerolineales bacterium]
MTGHVFMSYSRKDEEVMRLIAKFLRAQGIKVWVDNEKLIPGTPIWEDEVEKGIKFAAALVVVLSPDSKSSEWVKRETSLADQHHKRIFPVLVRGDENTSISLRLINRQFVDLRQMSAQSLKSLSDALSFYIQELISQEQKTAAETVQKPVPRPVPDAKISNQRIPTEKASSPGPSQATPGKADHLHPEPPARKNVFGWLTQDDPKRLIAQLGDVTKRDRAAQDLVRMGKEAVPALIEALQTKDANLLLLYQQILARIPSATPALIRALRTAHPIIRARVSEIFAINRDRSAAPALLEALQGEYFTVRSRSAIALGKMAEPKALQPLLQALKDREDEVRSAACLALGFYQDPSTFDDITNVLLDDPKIEVRQAAAKALGNTQHPAALPYLMEALHDSFWWYEREYAASDLLSAIEKMGSAAVDPLIETLGDKEGTVRKFAAILLGKLGDPRAMEALGMALYDMHHEVGKVSAEALAHFGAPAVDVLMEALSHPEMWIRIHAIEALSSIRDARVAPILLQMLNDPEREVKKSAIQSLGKLKDQRALPALQEIVSNRGDRELHSLAKQAMENLHS